ncbi:hypothetical protein JXO52_00650 [bacterium]|nr:hypothetical protein [bacterium]
MNRGCILLFRIAAGLAVCVSAADQAAAQSDQCFIYGRVTTISDNVYVGAIRWNDEELYWSDYFNSEKYENEFIRDLSDVQREKLNRSGRSISILGLTIRTGAVAHTHTFACQFGDIASLELRGRDLVELELKNGEIFELSGGSNDIGSPIRILDRELGELEIKWGRIDRIEFMPTPARLEMKFGSPLFGTVETKREEFTGFVQWDHDERLSEDNLDGHTEDGAISIPFTKIRSIEKQANGCMVTVTSGRELYLTDSNDVNDDNRGIIVTVPGMGRVDIPWYLFRSVRFDHDAGATACRYEDFRDPARLAGVVTTKDGVSYEGRLVYDLDEYMDIEMLDGEDGGLVYQIPFRHIAEIRPKSYSYSLVILRNGLELLLGESQDVTDKHDGVLVLSGDDTRMYLPWDSIEGIRFK